MCGLYSHAKLFSCQQLSLLAAAGGRSFLPTDSVRQHCQRDCQLQLATMHEYMQICSTICSFISTGPLKKPIGARSSTACLHADA